MEPFPNVLRVDIEMILGTILHHKGRMLTAFLIYFVFSLSLGIHCSKKRTGLNYEGKKKDSALLSNAG